MYIYIYIYMNVCMSGYLYCALFCICPTRMRTVFTDSMIYETRLFSAVCRTLHLSTQQTS